MIRFGIALVVTGAAVVALAGASTSGCTLTPTADDGGSEAATQTVGEQCALIASALCNAYAMCAQIAPQDCAENFNAGCCAGTVCNETSQTSEDAVQTCIADYTTPDCNALANSVTPSDCTGIPVAP